MRFIDVIKRSNKNLFRSKLRTFLTIMAVFIGAATLTLTIAIGEGVKDFIDDQTKAIASDGTLIIQRFTLGQRFSTGPQEYEDEKITQGGIEYFSQEDINKIEKVEGIHDVIAYNVVQPEYITMENLKKYKISVAPQVNEIEFPIIAGEIPDDTETGFIVLPFGYLDAFNFNTPEDAIGKQVTLMFRNPLGEEQTKDLTISAVMINSLVTNSRAYISQRDVEEIASFQNANTPLEDKYAAMIAIVDKNLSKEDETKIRDDLKEIEYSAITVDEQLETINGVITAVQIVLSVFGVIAILVSTFGIVNTLLMSIYERTKEIGLFRALGMSRSTIFSMFAVEAASIGFWGGLFGVIFAYLMGQLINKLVEQSNLFGFEGFELLVFPLTYMILIVLGLIIVSLISGVLPARKAARLDPIEALRYE